MDNETKLSILGSYFVYNEIRSSSASQNIPISDENSVSSKTESDSELQKMPYEEFMVELKKMADSDSEGTMVAKETLNDIDISVSSGESLSQAIDSAVKKVNSSRKQLKCGGGGLGFLYFFSMLFQGLFNRRSSMSRRREAIGDSIESDTDTEMTNMGWFSRTPLGRLFGVRPRRKPRPITKYVDKTEPGITPVINLTTTRIVEEYIVDENGVPTHRIIQRQPTDSTTIVEKVQPIQTPPLPVPNNPTVTRVTETISNPITREVITSRPISPPPRTPVTTRTDTILRNSPNPVSTIRREVLLPPQLPEITTVYQPPIGISQPPSSQQNRIDIVPPNPPGSVRTEYTRVLQPPPRSTEIRPLNSPPTLNLPNQISTILTEVSQPPRESRWIESVEPLVTRPTVPVPNVQQSTQPLRPEVIESSDIRPLPSVTQTHQNPDTVLLVPGAAYQRGNERPQRVYFDPTQNTYIPVPQETSSNRDKK